MKDTSSKVTVSVVIIWFVVFMAIPTYGSYHTFSKHSIGLGVFSLLFPPAGFVMAAESLFWHTEDALSETTKDPYSSKVVSYPANWEGRTFSCSAYNHIPDFSLGYYSDPSETEVTQLCSCLNGHLSSDWVIKMGRKITSNHKTNEIPSSFKIRGFSSKFRSAVIACTQNVR